MSDVDEALFAFARRIEDVDIPCMVVGSLAVAVFGEPRSTLDIDLVVNARPEDAERLVAAFPEPDYYAPPAEVVRSELRRRDGTFNIIDPQAGLKADLYPGFFDPISRYGMANRIWIDLPGIGLIPIAPPTCTIIGKLRYFGLSGQDKHLRDIRALLHQVPEMIDRAMLDAWATEHDMLDVLRQCTRRAGEE